MSLKFLSLLIAFLLQIGLASTALSQNFWSLALVGDAGVTKPEIQSLRSSILQQNVNQIVLLGDNIYDKSQTYPTIWNPWMTAGFNFLAVAIGNHNKGYQNEIAYFGMPAEAYSFVKNQIRFVVLNSDNVRTAREQASFLEKILSQSVEKQLYLIYHHPSVTVSDMHEWPERAGFQNLIRPLLIKYKQRITSVFNGHDHLATLIEINGLPVIVTGASYENRRARVLNYNDGLFQIKTLWNYSGGYYWVRLNFATDGSRTCAQFIRVDRPEISLNVQLYPKAARGLVSCQ